jgi:hypothetical protein
MLATEQAIFTPPQLAKRWGITADKVCRWILAGELEAMNLATSLDGGKPRYKITAEAVEAFEARRRVLSRPARQVRRRKPALPAGFVRHFRD